MATKKEKKINVKDVMKKSVIEQIQSMFENQGFPVANGIEYGMTNTTLIIKFDECDIQVKVVAPSAKNGNHYPKIEE